MRRLTCTVCDNDTKCKHYSIGEVLIPADFLMYLHPPSFNIKVSGLNMNFQKELQGRLFKVIFQNSKKKSKVNCFLFKVDGTAELPYYLTKPAFTTVTTSVTYTPNKLHSDSGTLVIALSVSLCVLLLVSVMLIIFFLKSRMKNLTNVNRRKSNTSNVAENIYADVGSSTSAPHKGQWTSQYLKMDEKQNSQNSTLGSNLLTTKSKTLLPKKLGLFSGFDHNKPPCQSLQNEKTDMDNDIYLQPVQETKNSETNDYNEVLHRNTLPLPKVLRTENCYSMLETNLEISTYESLREFGETSNNLTLPTNELNDMKYSNSVPSNVDIRSGSPFYFETVACFLNES
ncbi:uncharacterized protein LOC100197978 isoform X2 [Hydra vulgaris]|uniref:uncharacterized protein LOC100197978 isoform X2 n=1 Tax=Hydra vulgaris TaxID=6087 RepID=UPI001F5F5110|nr:uncharacterized protein LOC100197978 isoform X2 [Hydra vulgaris]